MALPATHTSPAPAAQPGPLALLMPILVDIDHARGLAGSVMLDAGGMAFGAQLHVAGLFGLGQFGVQRGPFGPAFAALKTKAHLYAAAPVVARLAVDGHVAGVHILVAQL